MKRNCLIYLIVALAISVNLNCENGKPFWFDQYDNLKIQYKLLICNKTIDTLKINQNVSMVKKYSTTQINFDSIYIILPNQNYIDSVYYEYVMLVGEENSKPVYKISREQIQQDYIEGTISKIDTNIIYKYSILDTNELPKSKNEGYWLIYCDQNVINYDTITIN
jgi:hypothetical protein